MKRFLPKKPDSIIAGIFIFLMLASFFTLSLKENFDRREALEKSSWVIYFDDPKGRSLDFSLENYSTSDEFSWELFEEGEKISQGVFSVDNQKKKAIAVSGIGKNMADKESGNKKILIRVKSGAEIKDIYKY